MKILRAVGLGVAIGILKFLMTATFAGFENALQAFFNFLQVLFAALSNAAPSTHGAITIPF